MPGWALALHIRRAVKRFIPRVFWSSILACTLVFALPEVEASRPSKGQANNNRQTESMLRGLFRGPRVIQKLRALRLEGRTASRDNLGTRLQELAKETLAKPVVEAARTERTHQNNGIVLASVGPKDASGRSLLTLFGDGQPRIFTPDGAMDNGSVFELSAKGIEEVVELNQRLETLRGEAEESGGQSAEAFAALREEASLTWQPQRKRRHEDSRDQPMDELIDGYVSLDALPDLNHLVLDGALWRGAVDVDAQRYLRLSPRSTGQRSWSTQFENRRFRKPAPQSWVKHPLTEQEIEEGKNED